MVQTLCYYSYLRPVSDEGQTWTYSTASSDGIAPQKRKRRPSVAPQQCLSGSAILSRQLVRPEQQIARTALIVRFGSSSSDEEARPISPVAVRCVEPVDALADAKVERLLQLRVHAVVVAPDQFVPPRPRAEACGQGARLWYASSSKRYEYEHKPKTGQEQNRTGNPRLLAICIVDVCTSQQKQ